ncbi:MAG: Gfo/Idh/MocA family oxidoreductase [Lentisphaeria bacterium]|nr:Gfo/Idh/MocA family oxidoreductase [Lentisphaeria bacterium]
MKLVPDANHIRLGVIGMTEGNGHPYSWSAMFNKFDREAMPRECPFPVIPVYLAKENYDTMGIPGAHMDFIACDQRSDAEHVAKLSLIPNVLDKPEEMIGKVDAVIIATDIGSEHVRRAKPFIEAGLPLFIDKPLCDNRADLEYFTGLFESGYPLMSSSSMRYCKEFVPYHGGNTRELGELQLVMYGMPKKWETYGIHSLEAVYPIVGPGFESVVNTGDFRRNVVHLKHKRGIDVILTGIYDCGVPGMVLAGTGGNVQLCCKDSYSSFRNQLVSFVDFLKTGVRPYPWQETTELMKLVIAGIESREQGGKEIRIW